MILNVIFPVWFIFIFPPIIFYMIIGNYIIDSIILLTGLKISKMKGYSKYILKIVLFGFLADIIGMTFLLLLSSLPYADKMYWDPFENYLSLIYIIIGILIAGMFIYFFNYRFTFKKSNRLIPILLVIFTMPYFYLLPTKIIYKGHDFLTHYSTYISHFQNIKLGNNSKMINCYNHIVTNILDLKHDSNFKIEEETFIINTNINEKHEYIALLMLIASDNTNIIKINDDIYSRERFEKEFKFKLIELRDAEIIMNLNDYKYTSSIVENIENEIITLDNGFKFKMNFISKKGDLLLVFYNEEEYAVSYKIKEG